MIRIALCLTLATVSVGAEEIDYARICVPVEVRAIWVDAGTIPKTEQAIRQLVRSYHAANINLLLPEVIARGYTVYPSALIERDPRFAGAIDPLPPMIDEAHKLGMEVHPWVWVFRAGYTKDRGAILRAHPGWVELSEFGDDLSANGGLWISPVNEAARDFLAALYAELARCYEIDGLHLDYIRYEVQSPTPYGYSPAAHELFVKQYAVDPLDVDRLSPRQLEWNRFRERQINTFVQRIALQTRAIRPNARISAAVGSDPKTARLNLLQNWVNWVENRWVDFVVPMAYTSNDATFARLVGAEKTAVEDMTILVPGIGLHTQEEAPEQAVRQVGIARSLEANGQALFASAYFGEPQSSALRQGPYASRAKLPFRDPRARTDELKCAAARANGPLSAYYCGLAQAVENYAAYLEMPIPYVLPTDPPLDLPENVVPLPTVTVPMVAGPITIDGFLDNPVWWRAGARVELRYTDEGGTAPASTTAYLMRDDAYLYVGFRAFDPKMGRIKASVTQRDGPVFYDDSVEVFLDPGRTRKTYYHFSINTLGTQFDQKVLSPAWNAEWKAAAKLGTYGWTAEIAIPFASMGVDAPSPGTKWGLNLTRNRWTTGSTQYLTWAVPYGSFHSPDRFGSASF